MQLSYHSEVSDQCNFCWKKLIYNFSKDALFFWGMTVKTFILLQKIIFETNAVLLKYLSIKDSKKKMYCGFHKNIKPNNCFHNNQQS